MKKFLQVFTCLHVVIAIASAQNKTIVFDSKNTDQGIIQFETETPDNNPNAIKITKVEINEATLRLEDEIDITLIIPGITNNKRTIIGERAFGYLSSDQVRLLNIEFKSVCKSSFKKENCRICKGGQKVRCVKRREGVQLPEDCSMLFANSDVTAIDLRGVDRKATVRNTEKMFYQCFYLQGLILSNFNTSNVTNMQSMFQNCSSLQNLDLSKALD